MATDLIRIPGDTRRKPALPQLQRGDPINRGRIFAATLHEGGGFPRDIARGLVADTQTGAWGVGAQGRQITLSSTTDHVLFPLSGALSSLSYPCTVRAWFRVGSDNTYRGIVNTGYNNSGYYYGVSLNIQPGSELHLMYGDGTGSGSNDRRSLVTTNTVSANTTYHVVGIFDTQTTGRIYVNGTEWSASGSGTATTVAQGSDLSIGDGASTGYETLDGDVYAVDVWSLALTASEVQRLYAEPWAGLVAPRYIPVATAAAAATTTTLISVPGDTRRKPALPVLQRGDPINRGLDLCLPLYEGGGTVSRDATRRHDLSTFGSGVSWFAEGLTFDHTTNGYAETTAVNTADSISNYPHTMRVIFRENTDDAQYCIFFYGKTDDGARNIYIWVEGGVIAARTRGGGSPVEANSTITPVTGQWYDVVYVQRSATDRELFVDGVSAATSTSTVSHPATGGGSYEYALGMLRGGSPSNEGPVSIKLAQSWSLALTASEVARFYAEPWAGLVAPRFVPVATGAAASNNVFGLVNGGLVNAGLTRGLAA